MHPVNRLLLVAYFLEVGLVLLVIPWSSFWERNLFGESYPVLRAILTDNFTRGGVSGLGIVNLCAAFAELAALMRVRREYTTLLGR